MKKILTVCTVLLLSAASVFAISLSPVVETADLNADFLGGYFPTYAVGGVKLGLGEGQSLTATAGGGWLHRIIYKGNEYSYTYNLWAMQGRLAFQQILGDNFGLTFGWKTRYEFDGTAGKRESDVYVAGTEPAWWGNTLYLRFDADFLEDDGQIYEGFYGIAEFDYAPSFMQVTAKEAKPDYFTAEINVRGGKTLYHYDNENGETMFSVTVKDLTFAAFTGGKNTDNSFIRRTMVLGNRIRGFADWTYDGAWMVGTKFDVELVGPQFWILLPRVSFFGDVGYTFGNSLSANASVNELLASVGAEVGLKLRNGAGIGLRFSYLLKGENLRSPGKNFVWGLYFGL